LFGTRIIVQVAEEIEVILFSAFAAEFVGLRSFNIYPVG
jgi:hypothetical protein